MMLLLRYANNSSRYNLVSIVSIPLTRRLLHLKNGPVWTPAKPETQDKEGKVKAFDEMPTRNSNILESLYDLFYMKRKGYLSRPDLIAQENANKYGPVMRNLIANEFMVQIVDPMLVEKVFRASGKYPKRFILTPWKDYRLTRNIPLGLSLQDGKEWQRNRQAINKRLMKPIEVTRYLPDLKSIVDDTIARLRRMRIKEGDRKDIIPDLEGELFKWSLEGVTKVLLDHRLGLLSDKIDEQSQNFIDAIQEVFDTTMDLLLLTDLQKRFNTKSWRRHVAGWDTTITVTKKLIEHRVDELMSLKEKGLEVKQDTFLGALIANSDLTRDEIFGNVSELIGGGIDTTSYTLMWTLYLLAHNPEAQEKLRREICDAIPVNKPITQDDFAKLVYMRMVFKESMRLRPVISSLSRQLDSDIELGGYHVPAMTTILTQFYPMMNDPNIFEKPSEFRPERWDRTKTNSSTGVNAFASIPFGFGTRMCVGRRFAEQEMYLLLAEIVRQFEIIPTKTVGIATRLLVIPDEPVDLKFIDRS